ncbi:MAG: DUF4177 domain-containing protein [Pirellulales bacterium]|nr:DUF4177 domain-containing protein [Pirellulales bacterium]
MKQLQTVLQNHQAKLWLLVMAFFGLLALNMAAAPGDAIVEWEYKTIIFKVEVGNELPKLRGEFESTLNREARQGWEFVGRCAHLDGDRFGVDYIVLRRPRPVY